MRRSTVLGLIGIVLVIAIGAYTAFWWVAAGKIEEAATAWRDSVRSQKIDASWQTIHIGGYPFLFRLEFTGVTLKNRAVSPPAELDAPALSASTRPWNFRDWHLVAPNGANATVGSDSAPLATLTAGAANGALAIGADGGSTIWLYLREATAVAGERVRARGVDAWVILPARAPGARGSPGLAVAALLRDLTLPSAPPTLGTAVAELGFGLSLKGSIPSGPLYQALSVWRDDGGTLGLDHFRLNWGGIGVTGSGTFALDAGLQPIGAISAAVAGYDQLMNALVAAGKVKASDARVARFAMSMLAKVGPEGRPEISTSLTIQDGEMFLGPARLGKAPRIDW